MRESRKKKNQTRIPIKNFNPDRNPGFCRDLRDPNFECLYLVLRCPILSKNNTWGGYNVQKGPAIRYKKGRSMR